MESGKLRVFYLDEGGNDVTCYFATGNEFISSYTSFLTRTPSKENIQALEDTDLYFIHRDDLEKLQILINDGLSIETLDIVSF